ncbi:sensor histidine kinase [Roseateles amylovorans]|uniref:histidine kinase n=1 Tax=Roseateles amylovorans TaxID=2978473 RepID=A0ABY6AY66_9BURK|nr:ATP-binding protein [Roseateles amylovorans]UXH76248.1 hypothetical protein N4261_14350 [Roseateles amylovorans]
MAEASTSDGSGHTQGVAGILEVLKEPPRWRRRWGSWLALALVLATLGLFELVLWTTSDRLGQVDPILQVDRYELRSVPADDPKALRFDGPLHLRQDHLPLPHFENVGHPRALHKARLRFDISRFITDADVFDERRDGDRQTVPRAPTKALLISQAIHGVDVYLNGVWLDGYPRSTATARFMWFRPLPVELPAKLLRRDGPNELIIDYTTWEPHFMLSPVYIGNVEPIAYVSEVVDFFSNSLANASKAFCFLAGVFMIGVWLVNRTDGTFGLIGLVALLWAVVYTLSLWVYMPPDWRPVWLLFFYFCTGALNLLGTMFVMRYVDQPIPRPLWWGMLLASSLAVAVQPLGGEIAELDLDLYWIWLLVPFQLWAMVQLARHVWRTRSRPALVMLLMLLLAGVLVMHDYNVMTHQLPLPVPDYPGSLFRLLGTPVYLTHLALPPLLVVMAHAHLLKYRESVKHVREANRILAETVRRREMALAVSYDRQSELERNEAAQEERDRIYRELHDGIGSQLVTTIFSVREGNASRAQLEQRLLDVLQGVREVISSTDTTEHREFQNILFDYCVNLDSLLSAKDFQIEYDIQDGNEFVLLDDRSRELLRIVEETVANTLKYARASLLRITLTHDDTVMTLTISDNGDSHLDVGHGVRSDFGVSTGQGLKNMKARMQRLGGVFSFVQHPDGATTTVTLPLAGPPSPKLPAA